MLDRPRSYLTGCADRPAPVRPRPLPISHTHGPDSAPAVPPTPPSGSIPDTVRHGVPWLQGQHPSNPRRGAAANPQQVTSVRSASLVTPKHKKGPKLRKALGLAHAA